MDPKINNFYNNIPLRANLINPAINKNSSVSTRNTTEEDTKEPNSMGRDMDLVLFIIVREVNMLEIGVKIKCMEKGHSIIPIKK